MVPLGPLPHQEYVKLNKSASWAKEMVDKAASAVSAAKRVAWAQAIMARKAIDNGGSVAAAEAAAAAYVKAAAVHAAAVGEPAHIFNSRGRRASHGHGCAHTLQRSRSLCNP